MAYPPGLRGRSYFQAIPATPATPVAPVTPVAKSIAVPAVVANAGAVTPTLPVARTAMDTLPAEQPAAAATTGQGDTMGKALTGLSVLQGIGGAISYATAKNPGNLPAPKPYTPPIRGAQGIEATSYEQGRKDILAAQTAASTGNTSDVASTAVQRLFAQQQANRALAGLAASNNQVYQTDRARVADQETRAYDTNYQNQQQYAQNLYAEKRQLYEGRRTQATAQVQGAIDNIAGNWQAKQQAAQQSTEAKNRGAEAAITALHNSLATATSKEQVAALLQQLKTLDPSGTVYSRAVQAYGSKFLAGGGTLPTPELKWSTTKGSSAGTGKGTRTKTTTPLPGSVATFHKMSEEFGRHLDRVSQQSRATFDRYMQTAIGLRSASTRSTVGAAFRRSR